LDSSIVQGPFSVAPCQTLVTRFATFASPYPGERGGDASGCVCTPGLLLLPPPPPPPLLSAPTSCKSDGSSARRSGSLGARLNHEEHPFECAEPGFEVVCPLKCS
jgi:hypothetical protein